VLVSEWRVVLRTSTALGMRVILLGSEGSEKGITRALVGRGVKKGWMANGCDGCGPTQAHV